MLQQFLEMLDNIFLHLFRLLPIFFRNVGFINYFCQHFAKYCNIFLKLLPTFFRNVGFVNYFSSTFCKMLQHFWVQHFFQTNILLPSSSSPPAPTARWLAAAPSGVGRAMHGGLVTADRRART
jgi:hypothetical protein